MAPETQRYVLEAVPTDEVVELDVVFSAPCASGASSDAAEPWCPERCAWSAGTCTCRGRPDPPFPAATEPRAPLDRRGRRRQRARRDHERRRRPGRAGRRRTCAGRGRWRLRSRDLAVQRSRGAPAMWRGRPWHYQAACQSGFTYCYAGSCIPAPTSCAGTDYSGCESYEVLGGAFLRGEDPLHQDAGAPATIHGFRLDAWELDVARFRKFVTSITAGQQFRTREPASTPIWPPARASTAGMRGPTRPAGTPRGALCFPPTRRPGMRT